MATERSVRSAEAGVPPADVLSLLRQLFEQARLRGFDLGPQDLDALRQALAAGFGWRSAHALRELLVALWAKSPREAVALRALHARLPWPSGWTEEAWQAAAPAPGAALEPGQRAGWTPPLPGTAVAEHETGAAAQRNAGVQDAAAARTEPAPGGLPALPVAGVQFSDARLIDVEILPMNHREVAQAFRRLRRPARQGPPVELDLAATVERRSREGVAGPPVLVPRRRNTAQIVLFVDMGRAMQAHALAVALLCDAIEQAGLLRRTQRVHFDRAPGDPPPHSAVDALDPDGFAPVLDPVLAQLAPHAAGAVFRDRELTQPQSLPELLRELPVGSAALLVTDAGAARGERDLPLVAHWMAFARALRQQGTRVAALNPVPRPLWARSGAEQFSRHLPMESLDVTGLRRVVDVLRGQQPLLECPL